MHQNKHQNTNKHHQPVLLEEVLQYLSPQIGESYLDLTAGYGGHAEAVFDICQNWQTSVLVDRDAQAVAELEQRFSGRGIRIRNQDFWQASRELHESGKRFDLILADLGVSSPHLNEASRGFAFSESGPLDMRMDQRQELSAAEIVNTYDQLALERILKDYGEEPKARQISKLIIDNRPISSTSELASIVARAWPGHSRVHPATRSFQALRIAVNDELVLLERSLPLWLELLKPGGRLVIISFHSLEDRIVKQQLAAVSGNRYDAEMQLLTKRPITASPAESVSNPRARSAKLRAAVKIKSRKELHADTGQK